MNPMGNLPDYGIYGTEAQRAAAMVCIFCVCVCQCVNHCMCMCLCVFYRATMILLLSATHLLLPLPVLTKVATSTAKMLVFMVNLVKTKIFLNNKCILPTSLTTNTTTCPTNSMLTNNLLMVNPS